MDLMDLDHFYHFIMIYKDGVWQQYNFYVGVVYNKVPFEPVKDRYQVNIHSIIA